MVKVDRVVDGCSLVVADVVVPEACELPGGATVCGCPGAAVDEHPTSTATATARAPDTAENLMPRCCPVRAALATPVEHDGRMARRGTGLTLLTATKALELSNAAVLADFLAGDH
jgi:hypothetical protein